ncbi:hypothetical protein [Deinococcus sp.]
MRTDPSPELLVVDDKRQILEPLELSLNSHGFRVTPPAPGRRR